MLVTVHVPEPTLVIPPAPEIAPPKLVLVSLLPVANTVPAPNTKFPPVVPPPANEPMFKLLLSCSKAPLILLRVTAELEPNALAWLVMTLPLLIAVLPV